MKSITFALFLLFSAGYSHAQIDWNSRIKSASKQDTRSQEVDSLSNLYLQIPKDSVVAIGNTCYFLTHRYKSYFNSQADSILKYAEIGIEAFQKANYTEYRLTRLIRYKGYALVNLGKEREGFMTYDDFDNLSMKDDRAIGSYLMAKVDQAQIFRDKGDNEAGLQLLEYAENQPFFEKAYHLDKFRFYFEKSIAYGIENTEAYNAKCDSAMAMAIRYLTTEKQKLNLMEQQGKIHLNRKSYNAAIRMYQQVFEERQKRQTNLDSINAIDALNNISHCHIMAGQPEKASKLLNKYIPDYFEGNISENRKLKLLDNLLSAYVEANQTENAEKTIARIELLLKKYDSTKALMPIEIATYQFDKANYYFGIYYNDKSQSQYADKTLKAIQKMDEAIIEHENNIFTKNAQILAKKIIEPMYKKVVDITAYLERHDDFYYYSERSKNNLLYQDLKNEGYDLVREFELLQAINDGTDNIKELKNQLVKVRKEKLDYLFLNQKRDYSKLPNFLEFKEKLDRRYCLNYSFGDSNLYLQTFDTHGHQEIHNLGNAYSSFQFESFYADIADVSSMDKNQIDDAFISHLNEIEIDTNSILILPDDFLFLYPFDLIKTKNGPLFKYDYSIELNGSISTSRDDIEISKIQNSVFITPSYASGEDSPDQLIETGREDIFELPYSYNEVEGIIGTNENNLYNKISKDEIKRKYKDSDLFHFNGHAILNQNQSFSYLPLDALGSKLFAYEFNQWKTNAKMVVLSACETGSGKVAAGEGVLNFSRSIIKSGAKSVISTLWPVNDQTTSKIISSFYKYLEEGKSKSMSLSKAKQDFLSTCPDYQKHPYYWAGITLTGDNSPITFVSPKPYKWLIIGSALLIFLAFFIFYKKK